MKIKEKSDSLTREFGKYVSLNVLGMLGLSCYILADTFFISRGLGADGLTALNLAIPVYSFLNGAGLMTGVGAATKYSIHKAQKKDGAANATFTHACLLWLILGTLFVVAGAGFCGPIAALMGGDVNTYEMTRIYLKTILSFAPFFLMNNILIAFIRNDGAPRLAMSAMLAGSLSNILLDYIFIFPLQMGMFGAAFATGLAPVISIGILSVHLIRRRNGFHICRCRIRGRNLWNICALGMSALITEVSSGVVIIVFNIVILQLEGNTGVAAFGVIANLALVVIAIFTGIAQGIQPIVSTNYGMGNTGAARKILRFGIMTALGFAVLIYLLTFGFADGLVMVFNRDHDVRLAQLASAGLKLYFTAFLFAGLNILTASYFSATEMPKQSFAISIIRGCVGIIPLVCLLAHFFGMTGVWISYPVTEALTAVLAAGFLWYGCRRQVPGN
ncbi:MATE family efflux transporter [Diplocloster hominis]|uniref:MATE family efflux transporter n=1 Tax=Diplocloster hominis TaxID=3079010 RepID=UPI0031BAAD3A